MGIARSSVALLIAASAVDARYLQQYKHEAEEVVVRRQAGAAFEATRTSSPAAAITSPAVLTYITPSPGASPIAVTEQSQLVSSYAAQYTLCELPPLAFFPVTPLPSTVATTAPYANYSVSTPSGNGSCTTIYKQTETMVCDATLTGLGERYTVTNCAQDITFSTEYGYVLASPTGSSNSSGMVGTGTAVITPKPIIQRLTTYYLAPWQSVSAGQAPKDVTLKVCTEYVNGTEECVHQYEVWHTSLLTQIATTTTSVNISTTIHGTSQVVVETFAANITDKVTTFTMTTDMALEYSTEITTTHRSSVTPTSTMTVTVEEATPKGSLTTTRTSTIHRTSYTTIYAGTSTATLPSTLAAVTQAAPVSASDMETGLSLPTDSVDYASMLGIATAR